jgi:RNA exonuclease NGL2
MPDGEEPSSGEAENEKDDEGELPDHDERSIAKTRPPREGDGVLEVEELVKMMRDILPTGAVSTLSSTTSADHAPADTAAGHSQSGTETFGTRGGLEAMTGSGQDEPAYTCYTPLFKLTLGTWSERSRADDQDYIFLLPAISGDEVNVVEYLRRPRTDELGEGLPRKGICASDHLAMGCGLEL